MNVSLLDCCSMYLRTECRVRPHKGQFPTLGPSTIKIVRGRGLIVGHVSENLFILVSASSESSEE